MLEPAHQAWGHASCSDPCLRYGSYASVSLRVCRRLRHGHNLERGVGHGRVAARQRGACVVVGQGVFRSGVGGHGRGLLLRLVEILQAAEAIVGTAVPAVPGEEGGRREPAAWAWRKGGGGGGGVEPAGLGCGAEGVRPAHMTASLVELVIGTGARGGAIICCAEAGAGAGSANICCGCGCGCCCCICICGALAAPEGACHARGNAR